MIRLLTLSAIIISASLLQACTPVGAGLAVGSAAGAASVSEGGLTGTLSDTRIEARINDLWFKRDFEMFRKLNLTVNQGRVLITGVVQKQQHRVEAVRLAWQVTGVKQVINEIKVAGSEGISGWARDNLIVTKLRTALLLEKNVQSVNYSIDAVQGVVYLMGVAQNQSELNIVMTIARNQSYVKNVISYVKLVGQPVAAEQRPAGIIPDRSANQGPAPIANDMSDMSPAPLVAPEPVEAQPLGSSGGAPVQNGTVGVPRRPAPIVDGGF